MATLTITATQGFEQVAEYGGEEMWIPGDPGDTYTRGDLVSMTAAEGILDTLADSEYAIGEVTRTTTCPAATVGIPKCRDFDPIARSGTGDLHLVPIKPRVAKGTPIYKVSLSSPTINEAIAAYTAATPSITLTTSPGADDDSNGALVYVFAGPGAGTVLTGADYVHSTKVLTTHTAAATALTTSSSVIVLEGQGSNVGGIGWFGRIDAADDNNLDLADGYDDGDWTIFMSYERAADYLSLGQVLVIPSSALYES